jgi:hypothetical protein
LCCADIVNLSREVDEVKSNKLHVRNTNVPVLSVRHRLCLIFVKQSPQRLSLMCTEHHKSDRTLCEKHWLGQAKMLRFKQIAHLERIGLIVAVTGLKNLLSVKNFDDGAIRPITPW